MAKIAYSNDPVKSFGGFHFVYGLLKSNDIVKQIDTVLGTRNSNVKYKLSDVLLGHFCSVISGGSALEDIEKMRSELSDVSGANVPSADTLARVMSQLTWPKRELVNQDGKINTIVDNEPLNELLCNFAANVHMNSIEPTLDIDAHLAPCDKPDAEYAYTKEKGYFPMVAFIDRSPVLIQNRSGNTSPASGQVDFVMNTLEKLKNNNINIKNFRADAASFNFDLMDFLNQSKIRFYIRAAQNSVLKNLIPSIPESNWRKGFLNKKEIETTEIEYNNYRVVVERTLVGQYDLLTQSPYIYRAIITNDWRETMTSANIIYFYNHRGDIERNFDLLRNDFGWANLPFNNIAQNTTYLIITACFMNLFEIIKSQLAPLTKLVGCTMRVKSFIFNFLAIPAKVIRRSRTRVVKFYTTQNFAPLEYLVT